MKVPAMICARNVVYAFFARLFGPIFLRYSLPFLSRKRTHQMPDPAGCSKQPRGRLPRLPAAGAGGSVRVSLSMRMSWFVKEGADGDAHRAGDAHDARGLGVDVGMLDAGDRLIVQSRPVADLFQRQPELLAQSLDALHRRNLTRPLGSCQGALDPEVERWPFPFGDEPLEGGEPEAQRPARPVRLHDRNPALVRPLVQRRPLEP